VTLVDDTRLESNQARVENRAFVDELISGVLSQLDQAEAAELLRQAGIAYGRVNDMAGLSRHPQLRRVKVETPAGDAQVVAVAAIRSDRAETLRKVPAIGEHSAAIRNEFTKG
jgi:crotonobetainyl-CoA:carnitine CoA-transferase CaiB-like acyl-CoA transferase